MRKSLYLFAVVVALGPLLLAGCTGGNTDKSPKSGPAKSASTAPQGEEAEIQAALAKLSPEDRQLAEAQKWCAVQNKNRLGSMDTPYKVMVKGQPVFLCCDGCEKKALADPDKTLAKVEELKKAAAGGK
jgi:outer membrane murein-binding lipoprotein Lpp